MLDYSLIHGDCLLELKQLPDNVLDSLVTDPPAGISFMGKDWDSDKGGRDAWITWMTEVMRECLRVLKPGAHGLVWALPRTSHWTATALENAGFEIRDVVTHLFGTGFPKSLNIEKIIGEPGKGMGTALKPASEHWILVRKPISEKTVAKNVLKWGTGALNIDASRVDGAPRDPGYITPADKRAPKSRGHTMGKMAAVETAETPSGRFPANLVLDEEAAAALDKQSGVLTQGGFQKGSVKRSNPEKVSKTSHMATILKKEGVTPTRIETDAYGASRFFYCAKASKTDKGKDNTHPTVKSTALMRYLITLVTPPNGLVLDPFMGSGSTGVAAISLDFGFLGIEKDEAYYAIATERLSSYTLSVTVAS